MEKKRRIGIRETKLINLIGNNLKIKKFQAKKLILKKEGNPRIRNPS